MAAKDSEAQSVEGARKRSDRLRHAFRTKALEELRARNVSRFENISPSNDHWLSCATGVSGCVYSLVFLKNEARVEVSLQRSVAEENKWIFDRLGEERQELEGRFGDELHCGGPPGGSRGVERALRRRGGGDDCAAAHRLQARAADLQPCPAGAPSTLIRSASRRARTGLTSPSFPRFRSHGCAFANADDGAPAQEWRRTAREGRPWLETCLLSDVPRRCLEAGPGSGG